MFDASAFEVGDFDSINEPMGDGGPPAAKVDAENDRARSDSGASVPLSCAICYQTFGDCAIASARAAGASPIWALALCTSVQRMARRAFEARAATAAGRIAYVLLGTGRSRASREADLETLGETMR